MMLPSDWSAIWYRCLICQRCFQFPYKLVAHRKKTPCGLKYLDLNLNEEESNDEPMVIYSSILAPVAPNPEEQTESSDSDSSFSSTEDSQNGSLVGDIDENDKTQSPLEVESTSQAIEDVSNANENENAVDSEDYESAIIHACTKTTTTPLTSNVKSIKRIRPFFCRYCFKSVVSLKSLATHSRNHRKNEKVFNCYFCGTFVKNFDNYTLHLRIHTHEQPYTCSICSRGFTQSYSMRIHQSTHLVNRNYKCITCSKICINLECFKLHAKLHPQNIPKLSDELKGDFNTANVCNICGARTQTVALLEEHVKSCSKRRKCRICMKSLKDAISLKYHMKTHATPNIIKINSSTSANLKRQLQKPTKLTRNNSEYTHKCKLCEKRYKSLGTLKRHMNLHSKTNPFTCKACNCVGTKMISKNTYPVVLKAKLRQLTEYNFLNLYF